MKSNLRDGFAAALRSVRRAAETLLFRPPMQPTAPVLRGKMRTAVVISAPDERFSEAVFVLRDEPLRQSGVSRMALLQQAAAAAEDYTAAALPQSRRLLRPGVVFLLGATAALVFLRLVGLL